VAAGLASRVRARTGAALEERVRLLAPARRLRFELTREALERFLPDGPARILDAGCGDGILSEQLARRRPAWTIVAADRDPALVAQTRTRLAGAGVANVTVVESDLTEDLGSGIYDAVAAVECLEEIPDDGAALGRMAAALRPGGLLVAHVPERDWRPVLRGSDPVWRHEVRHGYSANELREELEHAGLEVLRVEPTCRGIVRLGQELRDRIKGRRLAVRAAAFPLLALSVRAERLGLTWGAERALLALARRPGGGGTAVPPP
jgi:SAM-dependent methyltransferase